LPPPYPVDIFYFHCDVNHNVLFLAQSTLLCQDISNILKENRDKLTIDSQLLNLRVDFDCFSYYKNVNAWVAE